MVEGPLHMLGGVEISVVEGPSYMLGGWRFLWWSDYHICWVDGDFCGGVTIIYAGWGGSFCGGGIIIYAAWVEISVVEGPSYMLGGWRFLWWRDHHICWMG